MKSNLSKLFYERITNYKDKVFNIDHLIDDIEKDLHIIQGGSYEQLLRDYIQTRVRTLLNVNDCYKLSKRGEYVSLDNAQLSQLFQIEENLKSGLKGMTKSIEKVREFERNIMERQLRFVFCGNAVVGTEEEHSIETVLRREA